MLSEDVFAAHLQATLFVVLKEYETLLGSCSSFARMLAQQSLVQLTLPTLYCLGCLWRTSDVFLYHVVILLELFHRERYVVKDS